jgi:hypothetical protein
MPIGKVAMGKETAEILSSFPRLSAVNAPSVSGMLRRRCLAGSTSANSKTKRQNEYIDAN